MSYFFKRSNELIHHAVLTCAQMREAEALSCVKGSHSFYDLMQKAGRKVAEVIMNYYLKQSVLVLCGVGNNGGDGYVAAEVLRQAGWDVVASPLGDPKTEEAKQAAAAYQGQVQPWSPSLLESADMVLDALFGTGLTRTLEGEAADMVMAVTASDLPVVAADIPSGIDGDMGEVLGCAMDAELTVAFGWKKLGHVQMPAMALCGEVLVVDTGMDHGVLSELNNIAYENHPDLWIDVLPTYRLDNHKYDRGHALIMGGAEMTGASRLAARSAQRVGAGLVSLVVPDAAWSVYASACESIMVRKCSNLQSLKELLINSRIDSIGIGMGFGTESIRASFIHEILAQNLNSVLDADALTLLVPDSNRLGAILHEKCVLTPHKGEFDRLFGGGTSKIRGKAAKTAYVSHEFGCVILQKGADTAISAPDGTLVINTNAPPWLSTAGAGDVLAGIIVGLMAGGMEPFLAACAGAYYHGEAAKAFGPYLIAEDIIDILPDVLG